MAGRNQVEQVVKLNPKAYLDAQKQLKTQTRATFDDVNKQLQTSGSRYDEFTNLVKRSGGSLMGSLKDVGKAFADNLKTGAITGGLGAGLMAVNSQAKQAISVGLDFGRSFAALASRADLSATKVKILREQIKKLGESGADLASLPGAVNELYGATGNIDQSMSVMGPISQAASMTDDKDATKIAKFVTDRLKGEGRDINKGSVESVLQGLVLAQRGGEYSNLDSAMAGVSGIDANTKSRAKLSDRDLAALLAGTSKAGVGKDTAAAGLQALLRASTDELSGNNVVGGSLGIHSLQTNGKFDITRLGAARSHVMGLAGSDNKRIEVLKGMLSMSDQEASGVFAFIKNFDAMNKGIQRTMSDTKTLEQAAAETTKNTSDNLARLRNAMVSGFDDIFGPLDDVAEKLTSGQFKGAFKSLPKALGASANAVAEHPLLVAGGLASMAGAGFLMKQLGLGGGGLIKGVGMGSAMKQAGVQPVYVVNMGDAAMGGAGGGGGLGSAALGLAMGPVGIAAGAAAIVGTAATQIKWKDSQGEDLSSMEHLADLLDKYFGDYAIEKAQPRVRVDIHSKDPQFMGKAKSTDPTRKAK